MTIYRCPICDFEVESQFLDIDPIFDEAPCPDCGEEKVDWQKIEFPTAEIS